MQGIIKKKVYVKKKTYFLYLMILPFLFPRGFAEYFPWYHNLQRYILIISTMLIILNSVYSVLRKKISVNQCAFWVLLYHLTMCFITLIMQGRINEGLQKIFFAPVFFILCVDQLKKDWRYFLDIVSNILIIVFSLNVLVFNQWLFPDYFWVDKHITFIGHVQIVAQMGIMAILIGYIMLTENKRKSTWLIILGIVNMLYSLTLVSYLSLAIIIIGLSIIHLSKGKLLKNAIRLFIISQIISILLIWITIKMNGIYYINSIDVSMSGRMFVWSEVLSTLKGHWLFGYGAYGVLFRVFWNAWSGNSAGSNYAHNEILQLLIDGGIVLLFSYIIMMFSCLRKLSLSRDCREKSFAILLVGVFSIISLVESITEYYYFFGFLAIVSSMGIIVNDKKKQSPFLTKRERIL